MVACSSFFGFCFFPKSNQDNILILCNVNIPYLQNHSLCLSVCEWVCVWPLTRPCANPTQLHRPLEGLSHRQQRTGGGMGPDSALWFFRATLFWQRRRNTAVDVRLCTAAVAQSFLRPVSYCFHQTTLWAPGLKSWLCTSLLQMC